MIGVDLARNVDCLYGGISCVCVRVRVGVSVVFTHFLNENLPHVEEARVHLKMVHSDLILNALIP